MIKHIPHVRNSRFVVGRHHESSQNGIWRCLCCGRVVVRGMGAWWEWDQMRIPNRVPGRVQS